VVTRDSKVVILLATLNGARFLQEQLQSYRAQTHSHWELLVSDDGSTDQTIDLVLDFAKRIPQRVTLQQGPGQGFWRNFMSLVRRTDVDGQFFSYSDQDDIWLETKLEKAIAWLSSVPQDVPAVYFTRTILVEEDGKPIRLSPLFLREASFQNALVQNIGGGNTMVFNRAARLVLATCPEVALVSHDWWTYQIVTGIGGIGHYDPEPSLKYRQHTKNLQGSNVGVAARIFRLRAFLDGRFVIWNITNIEALHAMRNLLSPTNLTTLDLFSAARKASLPRRLCLIWKSGVYRQAPIENIALYAGALLGLL
jgi:glycosyltransferase involved in cell wall biosynthesis